MKRVVTFGPDVLPQETAANGGRSASRKLPLTARAKKVIEHAIEEAHILKHEFVGTEHLLLGLLREEDTVAAQVLLNLGLRPADAREEVFNLLGMHLNKIDLAKAAGVPAVEAEPTDVLYPELKHLPTCARTIVDEFDCQIGLLREEKEKAVATQDFEKAANLRDLADKLNMLRAEFLRNWTKSLS